ncbi:hypothetical protein XENORESO_006806, partial [Xenotaenia resolanae]
MFSFSLKVHCMIFEIKPYKRCLSLHSVLVPDLKGMINPCATYTVQQVSCFPKLRAETRRAFNGFLSYLCPISLTPPSPQRLARSAPLTVDDTPTPAGLGGAETGGRSLTERSRRAPKMSKKNEYSPAKINKREAVELSSVISRMQKNADQVEKNILRAEELLGVDKAQDEKSKQLLHQQENSRNLSQAEELLKDLFLDVGKARKLKHPQASEIEKEYVYPVAPLTHQTTNRHQHLLVKNLHDRWAKNCAIYRDLYDQVQDLELKQKIDWGPVLQEKLSHIMGEKYGPNLYDVEKQIAEHNILHQQIEAYSSQLQPSSTTSPEISKLRHNHLASLYEYMQSCSKELVYLSSQQERILNRDWSDRMVDTSGVRMEYEMLRDKVQLEWQAFLNLCIAQEMHLENVDNYKKFQLDADTLSESLQRLNSTLDPKSLNSKSNSEILLALERVEALRKLSSNVAPLKLRRIQPTKPTIALSLCDWADENGSVERGVELILKSNPDNKYWELEDSNGRTTSLPGACFEIPPPNPEALETMKSLDRKLADLKKRRSALRDSLKASTVEVIRPQKAALIESAPEDPKLTELNSDIDRMNKALARNEKEILNRLRTPLDTRAPIQDLEKRQQENEKYALTVRKLESDKSAIQREVDPILVKKPLGPKASMLPPKLSDVNNKIHNINTLIDLYNKKATASMFLEKQLEKTEVTVSWFEQQLTKDGVILDQPDVLQSCTKKLQNLQQDVLPKKEELNKLGKDLDLTKQACSTLQQSHDEYCPDIRRQESQVKLLKNRYTNINNQLQERLTLLKQASYKNQEFNNVVQSLDFFLLNLPDNSIKPTDGLGEIKTKENSQKRVMEDIQKRSGDIARLKDLSKDLQRVLN